MHPVPGWHCRWKHLAIITLFPTSDNTILDFHSHILFMPRKGGKAETAVRFLTRGHVVWPSLLTAFNA